MFWQTKFRQSEHFRTSLGKHKLTRSYSTFILPGRTLAWDEVKAVSPAPTVPNFPIQDVPSNEAWIADTVTVVSPVRLVHGPSPVPKDKAAREDWTEKERAKASKALAPKSIDDLQTLVKYPHNFTVLWKY